METARPTAYDFTEAKYFVEAPTMSADEVRTQCEALMRVQRAMECLAEHEAQQREDAARLHLERLEAIGPLDAVVPLERNSVYHGAGWHAPWWIDDDIAEGLPRVAS